MTYAKVSLVFGLFLPAGRMNSAWEPSDLKNFVCFFLINGYFFYSSSLSSCSFLFLCWLLFLFFLLFLLPIPFLSHFRGLKVAYPTISFAPRASFRLNSDKCRFKFIHSKAISLPHVYRTC